MIISQSNLEQYAKSPSYQAGGLYNDSRTGLIEPSVLDKAAHYPIIGSVIGACRVVYNIAGIAACAFTLLSTFFIRFGNDIVEDYNRIFECLGRFIEDLGRGLAEVVLIGSLIDFCVDNEREQICACIKASKVDCVSQPTIKDKAMPGKRFHFPY